MNREQKKYFGIHAVEMYTHHNMVGEVFVIQKFDLKEFTYWNREKRKWVNGIHEATLWEADKEGQTPYLANNVYALQSGFKAYDYELTPISYGLFPCSIKKGDLYLHSIKPYEKCSTCPKDKVFWTNYWGEALWIMGPGKAINLMWELIYAEKTGAKINQEALQNLTYSLPYNLTQ